MRFASIKIGLNPAAKPEKANSPKRARRTIMSSNSTPPASSPASTTDPSAGANAPGSEGTVPGAPASNPAPSSGAGGTQPPSGPAPLAANEVAAWLSLRGLTPEQINQDPLRGHVVSLDGCVSDRQLRKTLEWVVNWMTAEGLQGFDPAAVTVESLRQDLSAAAQRYAADPPPPDPPKKSFFGWLLGRVEVGIFWLIGAMAALAGGLWRGLGHIAHGFAILGRTLGRRWKPIAVVLLGAGLLTALLFGGYEGWKWWQSRPPEVAETTPAPQPSRPAPTVVAQPAPTPAPPPKVATRPAPTATGEVLQPPTGEQPYPGVVTPGATRPAIYRPALDLQCTSLWKLVDCTLPRGCTTSYVSDPPRLRVSCEDGKTWTDSKVVSDYPQNKRVSVHLIRSP